MKGDCLIIGFKNKKDGDNNRNKGVTIYLSAPDLKDVGNNGYRFVNAVSDFATHSTPRRKTANYKENIFARTADGNPLIDRAYQMVLAA